MAGKHFLFVTCAFGAFLLTQSAAITEDKETKLKPDIRCVRVDAENRKFNLTLVQRLHQVFSERTPIWTIESGDKITELKYPENKKKINGIFYGDSEFMATLLSSWDEDEHKRYYNGLVNIGTKIYNVESAADEWWRQPEPEQQSEKTVKTQNSLLRSSYVNGNDDAASLENPLTTLYPKILAVVDYNLYLELARSNEKVIEYMATFWNAVDLKYSKLISPKVKIIVKGVVIVKNRNVSLTIGENLKKFNENFITQTGFVDYDAAFIWSKSGFPTGQGELHLGSICNRQKSVATVKENTSYEGILSATHDLGHLLNLPHDGMDGAAKCTVDSENVTFMSTGMESEKQLSWSSCSRDILQEFSKSEAASCLENY